MWRERASATAQAPAGGTRRPRPPGARLIKLADKTVNLRDLAEATLADWPACRPREYFDWAASVVGRVRGMHAGLDALFDAAQASKPSVP